MMRRLGTIKVLNGVGARVRVWALIDENLAAHPMLESSSYDGKKAEFSRDLFAVTHVPSGASFAQRIPREDVFLVLTELMAMRWRGVRVRDMPVCELITCSGRIAKDLGMGLGHDISEQEHKNVIVPKLRYANRC